MNWVIELLAANLAGAIVAACVLAIALLFGPVLADGPLPNPVHVGMLLLPVALYFSWPALHRWLVRFRSRKGDGEMT